MYTLVTIKDGVTMLCICVEWMSMGFPSRPRQWRRSLQGTKFEIHDTKFEIHNTKFETSRVFQSDLEFELSQCVSHVLIEFLVILWFLGFIV